MRQRCDSSRDHSGGACERAIKCGDCTADTSNAAQRRGAAVQRRGANILVPSNCSSVRLIDSIRLADTDCRNADRSEATAATSHPSQREGPQSLSFRSIVERPR